GGPHVYLGGGCAGEVDQDVGRGGGQRLGGGGVDRALSGRRPGDARGQRQVIGGVDGSQNRRRRPPGDTGETDADHGMTLGPGRLPGPGGWSVAVQGLGFVLVPRGGRPVGVQDQGPAPAVDDDLVVEG